MAISVSMHVLEGKEKMLWAWSVSEQSYKFGSSKTDNPIIAGLIAVHSILQSIPSHYDLIIRTQDKEVNKILRNLVNIKSSKNPVIQHIIVAIKARKGFINCIYVSPSNLKLEDKRAISITRTVSGGGKKPLSPKANSTPPKSKNSLLSPTKKTTVKAKITRNKKIAQPLTTGLEEWDDDGPGVVTPAKPKTVKCDSCNAPISPLTNECMCSM